jgi:hypothetical protein
LVRDQITEILNRQIGQFTVGGINYEFRTSRKGMIYWNIWEDVDLKVVVVVK